MRRARVSGDVPSTDRPVRLRPGVTVVTPEGTGGAPVTLIRCGERVIRLRGRGVAALLPLLDGRYTLKQLHAAVPERSGQALDTLLERLRHHRLLDLTDPVQDEERRSLARALVDHLDAPRRLSALEDAVTAVIADGRLGRRVAAALERYRLRVVDRDVKEPDRLSGLPWGELDVVVVALDTRDSGFLERFNRQALSRGQIWLSVHSHGFDVRLGPLVVPHATPCWVCYDRRREANLAGWREHRQVQEAVAAGEVEGPPPDDQVEGVLRFAAELAAFEVTRLLVGHHGASPQPSPGLFGRFVDYRWPEHRVTEHRVLKLPRCPACSSAAARHSTVAAWVDA